MSEERLVNIETKIAFQEDMIEELNKVIYQQQQKLNQLEAAYASLSMRVRSIEAGNDNKSINERPPHY